MLVFKSERMWCSFGFLSDVLLYENKKNTVITCCRDIDFHLAASKLKQIFFWSMIYNHRHYVLYGTWDILLKIIASIELGVHLIHWQDPMI